MKLAIIGARGIGNHGGFETAVGELAPKLRDRGNEVYCSVREPLDCESSRELEGIKLLLFPFRFPESYAIGKLFEVLYDSYFVLKCKLSLKCDVVYCLGVTSGLALLLTKWMKTPSAVNIDGLEWRRGKFGILARLFLYASFVSSCLGADKIIVDNRQLVTCVPRRYQRKTVYISYGVTPPRDSNASSSDCASAVLDRTGLKVSDYWLVVARLEPENNIHTIIEAYSLCKSIRPLVIVGGCSSSGYEKRLQNLIKSTHNHKRIIMIGPVYNKEDLNQLRWRCFAYIHGHSVGGTNPSLLEAMSHGNIIICHDNVFNREVCQNTALYFKEVPSLVHLMDEIDQSPPFLLELSKNAIGRVDAYYQWDKVVSQHHQLFLEMKSN